MANITIGELQNASVVEDSDLFEVETSDGSRHVSASTLKQYATEAVVSSLGNKVDKVTGKDLSTNDFTNALRDKLAALEGSHFRGTFVDVNALVAAIPAGVSGDYADVDAGVGEDVSRYIWDANDSSWVKQAGEVTPLTAAQIKQLYESNPDTKPFDDAAEAKLEGIAAGATANQTDAYLLSRGNHTGTQPISSVAGLTAELSGKVDKVEGKELSTNDYTTTEKNKLSGIDAGATSNQTDAHLLSRANHTGEQAISTVTGLQDELNSINNLIGDIGTALDAINGEVI